MPADISQITANRYTRPSELPPGGVLVIGSGASGYQIAEDLLFQGREVYYSLRGHRRIPRHYRGSDSSQWMRQMRTIEMTPDMVPPGFRFPLVTGVRGGYTVDLYDAARRGVTLLGSLQDIDGTRVLFARNLNSSLKAGDETFRQWLSTADAFIEAEGIDAPPGGEFDDILQNRPDVPEQEMIDLRQVGISTVIWALGYTYEFGWIGCDVLDGRGNPVQRRGVTPVPGLYFLGLPYMYKLRSSVLWGVGEDAEFLAQDIEGRVKNGRSGANRDVESVAMR